MSNADFIDKLQLALHKYMYKRYGCSVIFANSNADAPPKPYATINVLYVQPETFNEREGKVYIESDDKSGLRKGWHKYKEVYEKIRVSITVYDKGSMTVVNLQAFELARRIQDWFSVYADIFLEEYNAVLTAVGEPTDRTTHIVDSYDYKVGFDIDVRRTRRKYNVPLYQDIDDEQNGDHNYDIIDTVIVTNERTGDEITTNLKGGDKRA